MWFNYLLTGLFLLTGICWVLDKLYFAPKRQKAAQRIVTQMRAGSNDAVKKALTRPEWLEFTSGLFGVVALVFVLRSFLYEPFRIPSGSMLPTLYVGDFILVNKYAYGIRLPIGNQIMIPVGSPKHGDIMVFQYPLDPNTNYIKRVIGLPGDAVSYTNKVLTVNGQQYTQQALNEVLPEQEKAASVKAVEAGAVPHNILLTDGAPSVDDRQFPSIQMKKRPECTYFEQGKGFECKVPAGHYFMMGDNRDNSGDSRYWGFVPEANVVGRASAIWMNWFNFPSLSGFTLKRSGSLEGK